MPKPPKELIKQIEIVSNAITSVDDLINTKKIKIEHYGKDFLEPLTEIRTKALELRNDLELFKHNMEMAITEQFYTNDRFASTNKVIDLYLSRSAEI